MAELLAVLDRLDKTLREISEQHREFGEITATLKAHMKQDEYIFGQYARSIEKIENGIEHRHKENRKMSFSIAVGILLLIAAKIFEFVHFGQ